MKFISLIALSATFIFGQTPYDTSIKASSDAQEIAVNRGAAGLWQTLKKLSTRASLIMVTAHPDDEDGGMLAYESRGKGARVALLTLNRGEGGANVMSPDYFDALGLVRTSELLAAGRYYGVDQYWTSMIDYGFSKTMQESIDHWTRDRVLADVVRVVRTVRPLIVTSVFVGGPSDGHGNHQTAGAMAQEVFRAAGDPKMFPDQIQAGLLPWQPVKVYARAPGMFARNAADRLSADVEIPEGTYDPVLGASYVQISREGLGLQKSQNGGPSIPKAGPVTGSYHRFGSKIQTTPKEQDFFDGIDTSLAGIAALANAGDSAFLKDGLGKIQQAVSKATSEFRAEQPERCAPALADGMKATAALIRTVETSNLSAESKYNVLHELNLKRVQFNSALAQSLALSLSAVVGPDTEPDARFAMFRGDPESFRVAVPGQRFTVAMRAVNRVASEEAALRELIVLSSQGDSWAVEKGDGRLPVAKDGVVDTRILVKAPDSAQLTRAYFSRPDIEQSFYDLQEKKLVNQPFSPYPLAGWAEWEYHGVRVRVGQVVQTVKRVTGFGTVLEPLLLAPAISVQIAPRSAVTPLAAKSFPVNVMVHSNVKSAAKGEVKLDLPSGWTSQPTSAEFTAEKEGDERAVQFTVTPNQLDQKQYAITAVASYNGKEYREGYEIPGYPGLRPLLLYRPATYKTTGVDVKIAPNLRVGYITGSGDDVAASLTNLGLNVEFLAPAEMANGDLSRFDVILLGVRTYAARTDLSVYNNRLLDYVKNGGVAIVQYNTPEFDKNYGPYPYKMGNNPEEVTDETSKVTILAPQNPLFGWPNQITEKDFDGWVEERGSKWMQTWDPRYEALLETHDRDQEPQKGGLLYARYGKGIYIYNAYAFYRQLPEGVAGAYRIFANMISLPKNPQIR